LEILQLPPPASSPFLFFFFSVLRVAAPGIQRTRNDSDVKIARIFHGIGRILGKLI
ncbi:hypothetical protein LINPERHAP1_LOCUS24051, partial [Linum perenne]